MSKKRSSLLANLLLIALFCLAFAAIRRATNAPAPERDEALRNPLDELFAQNGTGAPVAEPDNDNAAPPPADKPESSADFPAAASIVASGLPEVHLLRFPFNEQRSAMAWIERLRPRTLAKLTIFPSLSPLRRGLMFSTEASRMPWS